MQNPSSLTRRAFAAASLGAALGPAGTARAEGPTSQQPSPPPRMRRPAPPITVAMLVYPRMIMLDLVGPQTILQILGADIHLVGETMAPVSTDVGLPVTPTVTLADCPRDLDVLFVPGGLMGSIACMRNEAVLAFLSDRASRARFVTSVCTGTLVLAAAGVLQGYKATAHWGVVDLLPLMGVVESHDRVVQDRNRITGAGTTAGLDFGLVLAAALRNEAEAERVQLILEYDPHPPFHAGSPGEVGPERMRAAREGRVWMDGQAREATMAAAKRLGL